jgi:hypothetical protein
MSAERPSPIRLAPGHQALVQVNFRLLTCTTRQAPEVLSLQQITAVYRLSNGTQIDQHPLVLAGSGDPARIRDPGSLSKIMVYSPIGELTKVGQITTRPCRR